MSLDEGLLVGRDVLLQRDGLVLGRGGETAQGRLDLLGRHVQSVRDHGDLRCLVLHLVAQQIAGGGAVVIDQQPAFAIEDAAARREHGHLANAVGLGQHTVVFDAQHLQVPQAERKDDKDERDDILRRVYLAGRELFFAVELGGRGHGCNIYDSIPGVWCGRAA